METPIYRQGDVLIRRIAAIPADVKPVARDRGRIVLAYGEVTGHAHAIDAPGAEATLLTDAEEARFLRLVSTVEVRHEEHATITLPAGDYEVLRQREFDPETERFVAD